MQQIIEVDALADIHTHLREIEIMRFLTEWSIAGGADVLGPQPNTEDGLNNAPQVLTYIKPAAEFDFKRHVSFVPFVQITERTTKQEIDECVASGIVNGKVYPYGRTTLSENGVKHYVRILPIVSHCGEVGMNVHFHPEHPWMQFINRNAEYVFLVIAKMFLEETNAHIFWEHGSDARCVPHWKEMAKSGRFFLTLAGHHLATNEDAEYGDVRSVCKPPIRTELDHLGLVGLVAEDHEWVMAAGDSAFHDDYAKHVDSGKCACGAFTAPFLLPLYAHALHSILAIGQKGIQIFNNFTSRNARKCHHLPESSRTIKMAWVSWTIPLSYPVGKEVAMPFWAGRILNCKIVG